MFSHQLQPVFTALLVALRQSAKVCGDLPVDTPSPGMFSATSELTWQEAPDQLSSPGPSPPPPANFPPPPGCCYSSFLAFGVQPASSLISVSSCQPAFISGLSYSL